MEFEPLGGGEVERPFIVSAVGQSHLEEVRALLGDPPGAAVRRTVHYVDPIRRIGPESD